MSIHALTWAARTEAPCAASKLVLIVMADYTDERGECAPTMAKLAQDTQLPETAVRDHVRKLLDAQLITIRPYSRDRKNIFSLLLPPQ